jgi:hypothetical protein
MLFILRTTPTWRRVTARPKVTAAPVESKGFFQRLFSRGSPPKKVVSSLQAIHAPNPVIVEGPMTQGEIIQDITIGGFRFTGLKVLHSRGANLWACTYSDFEPVDVNSEMPSLV